jgi:hypothetical protein
LLERGVIPLRIQDGGVTTTQIATWELTATFPFIEIPRYQQSKSRAYFEFLIPHPEDRAREVAALMGVLGENQLCYGISTRGHDDERMMTYEDAGELHGESRSSRDFPMSVGAEACCEVLLPFLPDQEVHRGKGGRVDRLDAYMRESTEETEDVGGRVPLLGLNSWVILRVEAGHWGYVELDHFVLGAVQDVGMEVRWVGDVCEQRAMKEIERCGLEV